MKIVKNTLTEEKIKEISAYKKEPLWMQEFRVRAFHTFEELSDPHFGPIIDIDYNLFTYYKKMMDGQANDWQKV